MWRRERRWGGSTRLRCAQRRRRTQEDGQGKSNLGLGSVGSWFCLRGILTGRLSKLGRAKKIQTGPNYSADRPIYRALARWPKFGRNSFFSAENQNAGANITVLVITPICSPLASLASPAPAWQGFAGRTPNLASAIHQRHPSPRRHRPLESLLIDRRSKVGSSASKSLPHRSR